jgi:hypothetical protein
LQLAIGTVQVGQDLSDRRERGDRDRAVDLECPEQRRQVSIPSDRDSMLPGERDDLRRDRAPALGDNAWRIVPVGIVGAARSRDPDPSCLVQLRPRAVPWAAVGASFERDIVVSLSKD